MDALDVGPEDGGRRGGDEPIPSPPRIPDQGAGVKEDDEEAAGGRKSDQTEAHVLIEDREKIPDDSTQDGMEGQGEESSERRDEPASSDMTSERPLVDSLPDASSLPVDHSSAPDQVDVIGDERRSDVEAGLEQVDASEVQAATEIGTDDLTTPAKGTEHVDALEVQAATEIGTDDLTTPGTEDKAAANVMTAPNVLPSLGSTQIGHDDKTGGETFPGPFFMYPGLPVTSSTTGMGESSLPSSSTLLTPTEGGGSLTSTILPAAADPVPAASADSAVPSSLTPDPTRPAPPSVQLADATPQPEQTSSASQPVPPPVPPPAQPAPRPDVQTIVSDLSAAAAAQRRLSNGMTVAEAAARMAAIPGREHMTREQLLEAVLRKPLGQESSQGMAQSPTITTTPGANTAPLNVAPSSAPPIPTTEPTISTPAPVPNTQTATPAPTPVAASTPTPATASAPTPGSSTTPSAARLAQPSTPAQRGAFLQSLANYLKQEGIPRPPELFNPSRLGAILVDGKEFHVVDLFLHIVRTGGIAKILRASHDAPIWTDWLEAMGLPRTIPQISLVGSETAKTTDTVTYLLSLYHIHLAGFATFMQNKNRKATTPSTPAPVSAVASTSSPAPAPSPAASTPSRVITQSLPAAKSGSNSPNKKRKREKTDDASAATPTEPAAASSQTPVNATGPGAPTLEPPTSAPGAPSRTRYKVAYTPLHHPSPNLGGWDDRAVSSGFTRFNPLRPARSIHELGVIDMEAVLMGLRSRIPRELGYALTVLSMLSMAHPEDHIGGLHLQRLHELFFDLMEFVESSVFGEEGYDAWIKRQEPCDPVTLANLEQLSRNFDFSIRDLGGSARQEISGGLTDHALCALNILRNLSMFELNHIQMASEPAFCTLLSRIVDPRLARPSGPPIPDQPFSLLEFARVRRDCVVILTNVGRHIMLRRVPFDHVHAIFRLISSHLVSGFEITSREGLYGPPERPPPIFLTLHNAMEALNKLTEQDQNREVLGKIPESELVELFDGLIKMFPLTRRADEAMHTTEHALGYTESLAMALYSLTFMSPLSARKAMRNIPGAVGIIKRLIFDSIHRRPEDFRQNPFAVLTRRLCEVLGVLNGTATPAGESGLESVGFSAGAGDGKGWRWASGVIDKGWMSGDEERIVEGLSVRGMDAHAFGELDGMWWGD
ncbi:hypothetical protein BD324DRAFT_627060 [Kockovaella imperatae]|uniref:ARID domain-containing protein n=1 Tax=Kockovaella imperatae TaxID=4999 RepID=A0A1Y1UI35_9TREE|nr:hypothetical protein BD324DRAFT_627060 [Kockovaella imperatae]ORX36755.1 hypothetical protein BD324DRAFT_627060 [Kockovaella imperatae]